MACGLLLGLGLIVNGTVIIVARQMGTISNVSDKSGATVHPMTAFEQIGMGTVVTIAGLALTAYGIYCLRRRVEWNSSRLRAWNWKNEMIFDAAITELTELQDYDTPNVTKYLVRAGGKAFTFPREWSRGRELAELIEAAIRENKAA